MANKKEKIEEFCEEIYSYGNLDIDDLARIKEKFILTCKKCSNVDIAVVTEKGDDGYCETCSSPWTKLFLKCKECGTAIAFRIY